MLKDIKVSHSSKTAIVLFHGYGANADDLFPLHEILDPLKKFDWYFPQGHLALSMGGFGARAWFPIDEAAFMEAQRTGKPRSFHDRCPEGFHEAIKIQRDYLLNLRENYHALIVGGFSQGAMTASYYTESDGLVLLSGVLVDAARFRQLSFKAESFFSSHGQYDPVLSFSEGQMLAEALVANGLKSEWVPFHGGHEIPMDVITRLRLYLERWIIS
jgi:phospholipase/carboxylesterase